MSEYKKIHDDNGGHGHMVRAYVDQWGEVAVRCFRVTAFDPEDGTVESSELLLRGTIRPDGTSRLHLETPTFDGPYDAIRLGLAARRCYEAAVELLGPEVTAKWDWQWDDPSGWRTHPDAVEIAKSGWPKTEEEQ